MSDVIITTNIAKVSAEITQNSGEVKSEIGVEPRRLKVSNCPGRLEYMTKPKVIEPWLGMV